MDLSKKESDIPVFPKVTLHRKKAALNPNVKLDTHQQDAQNKILHNNGQILLDWKMGTGKTLGSIALFEKLKEKGKANKALVLVPAPLKTNYVKEGVEKFTTSSALIVNSEKDLNKITEHPDYTVVSNEFFRKDPQRVLAKAKPDTLIIDEAHKYKDPSSINYKSVMSVRDKFKNAIILTGTPMTNHPKEIISVLDLVTNKQHKLGQSGNFSRNFLKKKEEIHGPLAPFGIGQKTFKEVPKNMNIFSKEYNKYVHSHATYDANMPKKKVVDVNVPMSAEQEHLYHHIMNKNIPYHVQQKIRNNWPVDKKEAQNIFSTIIQARQVSNSLKPFHTNMSLEEAAQKTPKIKQVLHDVEQHLAENPKHKAILYTNLYTGGVDVLSAGLAKKGIKHGVYVGSQHTSPEVREQAKNDYLSGRTRAMIINQAGTEGLSLPTTTAHFSVDGHFNPAVIDQAEGRGIRKGSPVKEVTVYRYKSVLPPSFFQRTLGDNAFTRMLGFGKQHSTDEWIYNTADRKRDLNESVMRAIKNHQ
jgi:superfamily II DNA or RNA helicase